MISFEGICACHCCHEILKKSRVALGRSATQCAGIGQYSTGAPKPLRTSSQNASPARSSDSCVTRIKPIPLMRGLGLRSVRSSKWLLGTSALVSVRTSFQRVCPTLVATREDMARTPGEVSYASRNCWVPITGGSERTPTIVARPVNRAIARFRFLNISAPDFCRIHSDRVDSAHGRHRNDFGLVGHE